MTDMARLSEFNPDGPREPWNGPIPPSLDDIQPEPEARQPMNKAIQYYLGVCSTSIALTLLFGFGAELADPIKDSEPNALSMMCILLAVTSLAFGITFIIRGSG